MTHELLPFLTISGIIFSLGLIGFISRRNLIVMFLSTEVMFQAVILAAAAFARLHHNLSGQTFALMLLVVAAAEAAVGLALIILIFRRKQSLDADSLNEMRG
jgi:NADH-quinone oxidoreductase subunit K